MYEYIKGNITIIESDYIVIENNGIGYKIFTSVNTISKLSVNDKEVIVYTYLHVREDAMLLYGFVEKEEVSIFNMLIGISGVGPKAALSILSAFNPRSLALAIGSGDFKELSRAKGIGKKTAERIILELKDKFKSIEKSEELKINSTDKDMNIIEEAYTALMVLGYTSTESRKAVKNVYEEGNTLEELIRKSLGNLNS